MPTKLITLIQFIALILILVLLGEDIANAIISAFVCALATLGFLLCGYLASKPSQGAAKSSRTQQISLFSFSFSLALIFGYFAYWLLRNEAFAIICKRSPCEFGAYGWSVALLGSACALLMLLLAWRLTQQGFQQ